jgi:hypothetical protein
MSTSWTGAFQAQRTPMQVLTTVGRDSVDVE